MSVWHFVNFSFPTRSENLNLFSMASVMARALLLSAFLAPSVFANPEVEFLTPGSYLVARQEASSNQSSFAGYQIYTEDDLVLDNVDPSCEQALTSVVKCNDYTLRFQSNIYRGSLDNDTLTASVCDEGCGTSLKKWFTAVTKACGGSSDNTELPWQYAGGQIWAGWNETCLKDKNSASYCNGKRAPAILET